MFPTAGLLTGTVKRAAPGKAAFTRLTKVGKLVLADSMNVVPRSIMNTNGGTKVVGSIPTEVKRIFSLPRVVP